MHAENGVKMKNLLPKMQEWICDNFINFCNIFINNSYNHLLQVLTKNEKDEKFY
jgi:hypothetical protein